MKFVSSISQSILSMSHLFHYPLIIHYPLIKGFKRLVRVLIVSLLSIQSLSAQIKYVSQSGAGLKNGTSWANAYDESQLRLVLDTTSSGKQVWIAAGTYHPTNTQPGIREVYFKIHSGVSVYGGFAGTETNLNQRNFKTNTSILSGDINFVNVVDDNSLHVVVFEEVTQMTILDGLTISHGRAEVPFGPGTAKGGGIYIKGGEANVKVLNCTITDNYAKTGGGIYVEGNASPIFKGCLIQNNTAETGAGIATIAQESYTINALFSETFFIGNYSTVVSSVGAALNEANNSGNNTTSYTNCVFAENNLSNPEVGGIQAMNFSVNSACAINVTNCTFYNNGSGDNVRGKAINCPFQIGGTITNSIFWNNGNKNIADFLGSTIISIVNNTIQYGFVQSINTKTNNPEFFNDSAIAGLDGEFGTLDDGLNIRCYSPAKNAGIPTGAPTIDIIGTARPQDAGIDLGAYESLPPVLSIAITISRKNICSNTLVTFTATALNNGSNPLYQWKKNGANVGTNSVYFFDSNWSDNDSVSCEIASIDPCLFNTTAISNTIRIRISQRIYVNANATGANDGTSWTDAYTNLQTAFSSTLPCTPEIWVAKGVYKPSQNKDNTSTGLTDRTNTFKLPNINIYGGFTGNETSLSERDAFGNLTILSGDLDNNDLNPDGDYVSENVAQIQGSNAYNVVTIDGSLLPMALDGFAITGGNADMISQNGNSTFTVNKGGGIVVINTSLNLKIANCLISGNSAYYNGGGIMADSSKFIMENCIITNNYARFGGGLNADYSYFQLKNIVFLQNSSDVGGGIYNAHNIGGNAHHCVFYQNQGAQAAGGIQMSGANSQLFIVRNSIFWDNSGEPIRDINPVSAISLNYCDINGVYTGVGNVSIFPGFQNVYDFNGPDDKWGTSDDGLKLTCHSLLIDMGGSSNVLTDIIGTIRPYGSAPDIGAYEYIPTIPSVSITASTSTLCETSMVTITPTIKEAFGLVVNIKWIRNGIEEGNSLYYQNHLFDGDEIYCVITTSNSCTAALEASSNHITFKGYSFPVIYVDAAAPNGNRGNSWGDAINNLQSAINLASACTNTPEIWVKKGTYYPSAYAFGAGSSNRDFTFALLNNLKIYGGFNGGEMNISQRNIAYNPTILSGDIGIKGNNSDNCHHVVLSPGNNDATILDGFIIKDGNANGSGTINVLGYTIYRDGGGGLFTVYSASKFNDCIIQNNSSTANGGGIYFDFGAPALTNSVITNNSSSTGNGGGIFAYLSGYISTNCVFNSNSAGNFGGGIYQLYSSSAVRNSTFYNNNATNDGGGIYSDNGSTPIINCIVWGNNGGGTKGIKGVYYGPFVSHSNVQGGFSGTGNTNTNPLFVNASDPDGADNIWKTPDDGLALNCGSPAINTGTNTDAPDKDIIKTTRPLFSTVDMGAYEGLYFSNQPTITGSTTIDPGQNLILLADGCSGGTIKWYSSATTTIIMASNNPLTASPVANTTYYVTCTSTQTNCESTRKSIPVIVTFCFNNPTAPNYAANATATLKSRNIMTASNTVGANAKVDYQAVNSITLSPGFSTGNGAVFKATIQACN